MSGPLPSPSSRPGRPWASPSGPVSGPGARRDAVAEPVELDAEPDQVIERGRVHVPGHDRRDGRVAGDRLGGRRRPATAPGGRRPRRRRRGARPTGRAGPASTRASSAELPSSSIRSAREMCAHDPHRLPGPFGQQPGGEQPPHGFLQRVVVPLLMGAVIIGAGRGGQGIQHGLHELGAFRGQVPVDDPGPAERGGQLHGPVIERRARPVLRRVRRCRACPAGISRTSPRPARPGPPAPGPRPRRRAGSHPPPPGHPRGSLPVHRQISRAYDIETASAASAAWTAGCAGAALHPPGVLRGGAAGDLGPVQQPRERAVIPVIDIVLPGAERAQHRGPGRGRGRVGLLQPPQARRPLRRRSSAVASAAARNRSPARTMPPAPRPRWRRREQWPWRVTSVPGLAGAGAGPGGGLPIRGKVSRF